MPEQLVIQARDGLKLHGLRWVSSQQPPVAKILFIHGFAEYSELYEEWFNFFAEHGFDVTMYDQRGFGRTSPEKKQQANADDAQLRGDIEDAINHVSNDWTGPLFLWGHSMGGGLTLEYLCTGKKADKITGFIANSPYLQNHPDGPNNGFKALMLPLIVRIHPGYRADVGIKGEWCTDDESKLHLYTNNPKRHTCGTARFFYDMRTRGDRLLQPDYPSKAPKKPLLILQGTDDYLSDYHGARRFIQNYEAPDKTLKEYKDFKHELMHLRPENAKLSRDDTLTWLKAHL